jgi:TRAP-type C4-dicarboxylate transport system permease small subunit
MSAVTSSSELAHETRAPGLVRLLDLAILRFAQVVGIGVAVVLLVSITTGVVVRYLTSQSAGWINELPDLLFPWLSMAGMVMAAQLGQHILVDMGVRLLSRPAGRGLVLLTNGIAAAVFLFLARQGLEVLAVTAGESFPQLGIAMLWAYLALVLGFLLLGLTALTTMVRVLTTKTDPLAVRADLGGGDMHGGGV